MIAWLTFDKFMTFSTSFYRDLPAHPHDSATTWPAVAGQHHTHTRMHTLFFNHTHCSSVTPIAILNHTHTHTHSTRNAYRDLGTSISDDFTLQTSSYHTITYHFFTSKLLSYLYFIFLSVLPLFWLLFSLPLTDLTFFILSYSLIALQAFTRRKCVW